MDSGRADLRLPTYRPGGHIFAEVLVFHFHSLAHTFGICQRQAEQSNPEQMGKARRSDA